VTSLFILTSGAKLIKRNFQTSNKIVITLLILFLSQYNIFSQYKTYNSSEIQLALKKLNVLGSVLYIAAHPDDENTSILAYMSKGKLYQTAYLSLTRGDGGQNLLGNEKGDLLGVVRTQELLSARNIDGGQQFFSRAIDFGYSKTADETLVNWDRGKILEDIVYVIRKFRPDVILTRFSNTRGGHGHHLASAILAEEAFFAVADATQFPEQLENLKLWQPKRIYWNTWLTNPPIITIDVGEFNPILGKSYQEISASARSMHKTQGFGVSPNHGGSNLVHFRYTAGDTAKNNLFDNVDVSWNRISQSNTVQNLINQMINKFNPEIPQNILPDLVKIYKELEKLLPNHWAKIKISEVKELIKMCSGLWMEAIVWEPGATPGSEIDVRYMITSRANSNLKLFKIDFNNALFDSTLNIQLHANQPFNLKKRIKIPDKSKLTTPYWLKEIHNGKMFNLSDKFLQGNPDSPSALMVKSYLTIDGIQLIYRMPVVNRWNDAIKGEQYRPFVIYPDVSLELEKSVYLFSDKKSKKVTVAVEAFKENVRGDLILESPTGWNIEPKSIAFELKQTDEQQSFTFQVQPTSNAKNGLLKLKAKTNSDYYSSKITEVKYEHIELQTVLQPAVAKAVQLDINIEQRKIGYIMGSGDEIPETLTQLGYEVELLSDQELEKSKLNNYDVIICGIRAFNVRENLERLQNRLIEFVENGGTWIVQHNTRFGKQVNKIGPYEFSTSGRDRISEENAKLHMLIPDHSIFNYPNKITDRDFKGWVQERGLYFADSWKGKLYPLLSGNDEGEPAKLGGLLYAKYGKGVFIFTAYSWFRQLPSGIPGAIRLFVNLVST
jgi:LmbE family N-acetylglucosaminyl deacetylase